MGKFLFSLFTTGSLFACGAALYVMARLAWRRPRRWGSYFATKLAVLMIVGVLLAVVMPNETEIPPSPEALVYITALFVFAGGVLGVSKDLMERAAKRRVSEEVAAAIHEAVEKETNGS